MTIDEVTIDEVTIDGIQAGDPSSTGDGVDVLVVQATLSGDIVGTAEIRVTGRRRK